MKRLSEIAGEMSDELQGVGTGQVVAVLDLVVFGQADADYLQRRGWRCEAVERDRW